MRHTVKWAIGLVILVIGARPLMAEEVSYTVALDSRMLLPASCGALAGNNSLVPISLGGFKDTQPDKQVAQLQKGSDTQPVYLNQPVAEVVKEGISALLQKCGYRLAGKKESKKLLLTGDVRNFRVDWQKKLVTAKGSGSIAAQLTLVGPDGSHYSFNLEVQSEAKGLRKKGASQIEGQLQEAYKSFLVQLSQNTEFAQAIATLSKKAKTSEGASSYPLEQNE